ncbi:hypothetical protein [Streptomyces sp. NPDC001054]
MSVLSGRRVFDAVDAEWTLVCADSAVAGRVAGWLASAGALPPQWRESSGLAGLLVELQRRSGGPVSDVWMHALLSRAAESGEPGRLAARVMLQAMVPGAVRLSRRLLQSGQPGRGFDDVGQVVLSAMWQVIRDFPLRRRHKVAANVLLETLHRVSRELPTEDLSAWHVEGWEGGEELERYAATARQRCGGADGNDLLLDPARLVERADLAERSAGVTGEAVASEDLRGARAELAELMVWAVESGVLERRQAGRLLREAMGGSPGAGVSASAARQRRCRAVGRLRVVARAWVRAA